MALVSIHSLVFVPFARSPPEAMKKGHAYWAQLIQGEVFDSVEHAAAGESIRSNACEFFWLCQ